jgi:apolipoprotein N-acyltransferase
LTLAAAGDSDSGLVIWPETILRAYVRHDQAMLMRVRRLVTRLRQPLLFGTLDLPAAGFGELNIALLMLADLRTTQTYEKRELLPFAEYVPGARWMRGLDGWRTTGEFVPGKGSGALDLGSGKTIAPAICFEVLRPGVFNQLVGGGAGVLVNLSDDSWFAGTAEPEQHLQVAALRAVETRRWLVRSSDSGISAVIDPTGAVTQRLDVGVVGSLRVEVPLEDRRTLYVRLGDWMIPFCIALMAAHWRWPDRRCGWTIRRRA